MSRMIFVNLPVRDLARARAFYASLGFSINEMFSDDTAASVVVSDTIFVMLLTHARYAEFTPLAIGDPQTASQHLLALSCDSRAEVDGMMAAAIASGGAEPRPTQDLGFMYSRCFSDPDGHAWEPFWMDQAAAESGPPDMKD